MKKTTPDIPLRVEVDHLDTTSWGNEHDPAWRHVDEAGHGHFYAPGFPTLHEVTETMVDPDDGDEWEAHVRWECPHCGEHIEPGKRSSHGRSTTPGRRRYFVGDQEVDRDEFLAAWRPQAGKRLADEEAGL